MTAALTEPTIIDRPGIYEMPDAVYHADPVPGGSLSSGGARKLLPPSCPALFAHDRANGETHRPEYDLGHAAHMLNLGAGAEIVVIEADNYKTTDARQQRDDAYAAHKIPLLTDEYATVTAMAAALRRNRQAAALLDTDGLAEQSLFWTDPETGIWCRARPDWLTTERIVDYKSTTSVAFDHIVRAIHSFGYFQQAPWYLDGAIELDLIDPDAPFTFIFQAKTPPYLVRVVELDDIAMRVGADLNRQAREIYRDCTAADIWPDYGDDIDLVSLPSWFVRRYSEETY